MKILMVCLGNICRSPVAEGIMKTKAAKYHLNLAIDSAGTSGWHNGSQPDGRSVKNAAKNGVDISTQESRKVMLSDFELFDVVYAMDKENYNNLINLAPHGLHYKIKMILNEAYPGEDKSVPDPYYTDDGFDQVYSLLDEACENIALNIKKNE